MIDSQAVLFFDGVCNLCNRFIDFIIRRDRVGAIKVASLQGETARAQVPEFAQAEGLGTVVLVDEKGKHVRSAAVGRTLKLLGGGWKVLGALLLAVPRPIRDAGYRLLRTTVFDGSASGTPAACLRLKSDRVFFRKPQ